MIDALTERVREKASGDASLGACIKFDLKDEGVIVLDAKSNPTDVHNNDVEADCTITMSPEDFEQMLDGSLDATTAFMMGRIQVKGDMAAAMKLSDMMKR